MNRKTSILKIAAMAVLVAACGHQTPVGQPELVSLNRANFSALKESFNSAPGSVRVVALLSPT
jgi:hypothetical protein